MGDEIAITPTISPGSTSHDAYDVATISATSGRSITVATRTNHPHPAVEISPSRTMYAEVLNLTRNVCIEGHQKAGRTSSSALVLTNASPTRRCDTSHRGVWAVTGFISICAAMGPGDRLRKAS
jgi:hypothetical protein